MLKIQKLAVLLAVPFLTPPPLVSATQLVSLDFDTFTTPAFDPDDYVYTAAEKVAVKETLESIFFSDPTDPFGGPFGIKFDIVSPSDPPPPFATSRIDFNKGFVGSADQIDFRNLDDDDDAEVKVLGLLKS